MESDENQQINIDSKDIALVDGDSISTELPTYKESAQETPLDLSMKGRDLIETCGENTSKTTNIIVSENRFEGAGPYELQDTTSSVDRLSDLSDTETIPSSAEHGKPIPDEEQTFSRKKIHVPTFVGDAENSFGGAGPSGLQDSSLPKLQMISSVNCPSDLSDTGTKKVPSHVADDGFTTKFPDLDDENTLVSVSSIAESSAEHVVPFPDEVVPAFVGDAAAESNISNKICERKGKAGYKLRGEQVQKSCTCSNSLFKYILYLINWFVITIFSGPKRVKLNDKCKLDQQALQKNKPVMPSKPVYFKGQEFTLDELKSGLFHSKLAVSVKKTTEAEIDKVKNAVRNSKNAVRNSKKTRGIRKRTRNTTRKVNQNGKNEGKEDMLSALYKQVKSNQRNIAKILKILKPVKADNGNQFSFDPEFRAITLDWLTARKDRPIQDFIEDLMDELFDPGAVMTNIIDSEHRAFINRKFVLQICFCSVNKK